MASHRQKVSNPSYNRWRRDLRVELLEVRRVLNSYGVINSIDNGSFAVGTLSWAIKQVNDNPGGLHTITFSVSDVSWTGGQLPDIVHPLTTIDGTRPGGGKVTITNNGTATNGLTYDGNAQGAGWLTVQNVEMKEFGGNAIRIQSLGDGDRVTIQNSVLHDNGSAGISFNDIASGSGASIQIVNNYIYNNGGDEISITSPAGTNPSAATNNITGNTIGRNETGTAFPSGGWGIHLGQNATRFNISGNAIENNTSGAITLLGTAGKENQITTNSFRNNGGMLIDLNNDGASINDSGDHDLGANRTQNKPELRADLTTLTGNQWNLTWTADFEASGEEYRFEFYRYNSVTKQWSYVISRDVAINATPMQISQSFTNGTDFSAGDVIAAVAIGKLGDNLNCTSEFSEPIYLSAAVPTYLVTTAQDQVNDDKSFFNLSLREALLLATNDNETIGIAPWVVSIFLSSLLPTISHEVTITGLGNSLTTIYANGNSHVFVANDDLTLRQLLLAGASSTAINSTASLTIDEVEIIASGGGISLASNGTLTVSNSTIAQNTGRGVFVAAQSTLFVNSTISSNDHTANGAGIYVGYRSAAQPVVLVNTTLTQNRAFASTAVGSLPSDRAGGIYVESDMDVLMYNTIVAGNLAGSGSGTKSDLGVQVSVPHSGTIGGSSNLIGVIGNSGYSGAGIIIGTSDPLLTSLGNYGGLTRTHALRTGCAAIDAGDNAIAALYGLDEDQRGQLRPVDFPGVGRPGARVDIGAVELAVGEIHS